MKSSAKSGQFVVHFAEALCSPAATSELAVTNPRRSAAALRPAVHEGVGPCRRSNSFQIARPAESLLSCQLRSPFTVVGQRMLAVITHSAPTGRSTFMGQRCYCTTAARRNTQPCRVTLKTVAATFQIGSYDFPSKKAAQYRIRSILKRPVGTVISRESAEDFRLLCQLLLRHPAAFEKIGSDSIDNISHFSTVRELVKGTYQYTTHFMLHRGDGSETDFSYRKCLDSRTASINKSGGSAQGTQQLQPLPNIFYHKALRNAITPQIMQYRDKAVAVAEQDGVQLKCPLKHVALNPDNTHVDHVAPKTFKYLVDSWLADQGICLSQLQIESGNMTCPKQKRSWQQYHQQHAELRLLSSRANLALDWTARSSSSSSTSTSSASINSEVHGQATDSSNEACSFSDSSSPTDSCSDSSSSSDYETVLAASSPNSGLISGSSTTDKSETCSFAVTSRRRTRNRKQKNAQSSP